MIEVIVPTLRQEGVERLVASLVDQTRLPDVISIVSNEIHAFPTNSSIPIRILRFESDEYSIGELDVALRQNVGIFSSECDHIVISCDDQVAPASMIADCLNALSDRPYIWGNHHLVRNFDDFTIDEIRQTVNYVSRENPTPPTWHGYQSCYGGMFCAETALLREMGGFDMAFNGRHGSEDQQLGYRLMRRDGLNRMWISDPPFSWHAMELKDGDDRARAPWMTPLRNGCDIHETEEVYIEGCRFNRCLRCSYQTFADEHHLLFRSRAIIPYRPELVKTTSVWLRER